MQLNKCTVKTGVFILVAATIQGCGSSGGKEPSSFSHGSQFSDSGGSSASAGGSTSSTSTMRTGGNNGTGNSTVEECFPVGSVCQAATDCCAGSWCNTGKCVSENSGAGGSGAGGLSAIGGSVSVTQMGGTLSVSSTRTGGTTAFLGTGGMRTGGSPGIGGVTSSSWTGVECTDYGVLCLSSADCCGYENGIECVYNDSRYPEAVRNRVGVCEVYDPAYTITTGGTSGTGGSKATGGNPATGGSTAAPGCPLTVSPESIALYSFDTGIEDFSFTPDFPPDPNVNAYVISTSQGSPPKMSWEPSVDSEASDASVSGSLRVETLFTWPDQYLYVESDLSHLPGCSLPLDLSNRVITADMKFESGLFPTAYVQLYAKTGAESSSIGFSKGAGALVGEWVRDTLSVSNPTAWSNIDGVYDAKYVSKIGVVVAPGRSGGSSSPVVFYLDNFRIGPKP